ncbi:MAG: hypothetical protein DRI91_02790 [Aquificota bacterium]|nr:MAG: hypothetical protein DRI91_02790 [Aquificota bacterium]
MTMGKTCACLHAKPSGQEEGFREVKGLKLQGLREEQEVETPTLVVIHGGFSASHGGYLALMAASKEEAGSVIDAYGPTNWLIQWRYVKEHRPDILKKWRIYLAISRSVCREMNLEFNRLLVHELEKWGRKVTLKTLPQQGHAFPCGKGNPSN